MITGDDIQLVTFRVGGQEFAFDILQVERILRYVAPAPLPKAPEFLEGVVPYEGGAVPVVDLRKRFELTAPIREETRLMVLELGDQRVGVLVDEVREVMRVDSTTISGARPDGEGLAAAYIAGIVTRPERTIIILNATEAALLHRAAGADRRWRSRDERALAGRAPGPVRGDRGAARVRPASRRTGTRSSATSSPSSSGWTRALDRSGRRSRKTSAGWSSATSREPPPTVATAPQFTGARPGGAGRPPRRLDLHREGLEPDLAGRLRRRHPGAGEGARRCRPARSRRSRCWAGPRCCTRTTTTRWAPSPGC